MRKLLALILLGASLCTPAFASWRYNYATDAPDYYQTATEGGGVTSVSGTAGQITSTGGQTPVLSLVYAVDKFTYTAVSDTAYAVLTTDQVIEYTTLTAARTVTLPTAASVTGKWYIIKDGTGKASYLSITIATTSSQTIDGSTTLVMSNAYQVTRVYSNGSNWSTY